MTLTESQRGSLAKLVKDISQNPDFETDEFLDAVLDEHLTYAENRKLVTDALGKATTPSETLTAKNLKLQIQRANAQRQSALEDEERALLERISQTHTGDVVSAFAMKAKILTEVEAYNPSCGSATWSSLFAAMNSKHGDLKSHVLNKGPAGVGKSRSTSELYEKILKLPFVKVVRGYHTPRSLYDMLKAESKSIVVLDEAELTLENKMSLFILRSMLYGGRVCWNSSTSTEPEDEFEFEGTLVSNVNTLAENSRSLPLADRVLFNEINLTTGEFLKKMESVRSYEPDEGVWACVRDRIITCRNQPPAVLTPDEEDLVFKFVTSELEGRGEVFYKNNSTRGFKRVRLAFTSVKSFFGRLDEDLIALAKKLSRNYLHGASNTDIVQKMVDAKVSEGLSRAEVVEAIQDQRGVTARTAQRIVSAWEKANNQTIRRSRRDATTA